MWYFLLAVIVTIIITVLTKRWTVGVLIGYVLIILGETFLFRKPFEGQHFQSQLFWSYEVWDVQKVQIIANVLLFVPLGFLVGSLWKWRGVIVGAGFSIVIELFQLISQRGLFEFDDILHNTLGTFIGVSIYMLVETLVIRKRIKDGLYK